MGSDGCFGTVGPSPRPWFSWDICSGPWTNWNGDQYEYGKAVCRWSAFHYNLPDESSNKITVKNRGIVLLSTLCGTAKDLCERIEDENLNLDATKSRGLIISTIYKCYPLSVVTVVYEKQQRLLCTRRENIEFYKILGFVLLHNFQNSLLWERKLRFSKQ